MRRRLIFSVTILWGTIAIAGGIKTVTGQYEYVAPETVSPAEARHIALDRAKVQALADEFGTIISSEVWTEVKNDNGQSSTGLWSLGSNWVKGEWLETIGEPQYETLYQNDLFVVRVTVRGRARAIESAPIDIKAELLSDGADKAFRTRRFVTDNHLLLQFQSPVSGYLTVYLVDDQGKAFRLLPLRGQSEGAHLVKGNQEYIFFDRGDRYRLYTRKKLERNTVYIIFSPTEYVRPLDKQAGEWVPQALDFTDFSRWLSKIRAFDRNLQVVVAPITIVSNEE